MSPGAPLDVGVVGVGHLGRHHARLYAQLDGVRLVAVADSDFNRARTIADEYGCEAFADAADLVGRVVAASIAVPTHAHRDVAVQLLNGGVDVLVEKPLAQSLAECDAILDAAERGARLVMVGHTERFNPAVRVLIEQASLPRFFEIHRLAAFSARSTDIDVVLDLMIHDLDLLLAIDGSEPLSVDAAGVAALTDKVDIANARIRFASGCVANLTASRISTEAVRRIRLFQERTYLSCDAGSRKVDRYRLVAGPDGVPRIEHDRLPVADTEPLAEELAAFRDAVRSRTTPPVDGRQARRAIALAYRVRESIDAAFPTR